MDALWMYMNHTPSSATFETLEICKTTTTLLLLVSPMWGKERWQFNDTQFFLVVLHTWLLMNSTRQFPRNCACSPGKLFALALIKKGAKILQCQNMYHSKQPNHCNKILVFAVSKAVAKCIRISKSSLVHSFRVESLSRATTAVSLAELEAKLKEIEGKDFSHAHLEFLLCHSNMLQVWRPETTVEQAS